MISADASDNAQDRAYQYDAIGNREKAANSLTLAETNNYTANSLNQYTAIPQAPAAPVFDDDGNMISGPLPVAPTVTSGLTWDGENRLIQTQVGTGGPAGPTLYLYDSQSRRIAKTTDAQTTVFLYDGWNVVAEYTTFDFQTFDLRRSYLFGLDLSGSMQGAGGVGGLLSFKIHNSTSSSAYYPCYDGNGNVTEYIDSNGAVIAHFEYDPFGNTVVNTDTDGLFNYKFSTKPLDSETGFYYYGYRYYDPLTGRWPSRDPIAERGGVNLYGFVHNRSTGRVDKLGLICTQLSFKWTTEPSPSSTKVEFESPAGGLMNAKRFTLYWSGVAEVRCCCEGNNFTKTGVMIGSYEVDVGGDNLFITGGNPMPMEVSAPTALGEAVAEIIGELIGGLGDLPSSSPSEINDLKIGLADVYDKWKFETPKNFIWKDGWPCKKK